MLNLSRSPNYNIKAVVRETGLKADVLRAWERRYELPKPYRTSGGHRLYSEYDIEIVKWLRARQAESLSISRAVELWKEIVDAGREPLTEYSLAGASLITDRAQFPDSRVEVLRQAWLEANLAFNSIKVDEVLNQAFAIYPVEQVCSEIIQKGISEIGNDWYLGKVSVQQEHFASALAARRLDALIAATPPPTHQRTVLLGCPPGERHNLSILLLSLYLGRRGLKTVYLGADVPIEKFEDASAATQSELIVFAAQQLPTAATLLSAVQTLQAEGVPVAYGGLIFNRVPGLRGHVPAYFLGENLDESVRLIEQWVVAPTPLKDTIRVEEVYQELGRLYRQKRSQIEIRLLEEARKLGLDTEYLDEANMFFGNGLDAALVLGDPTFLEPDLDWIKKMLSGRRFPAEVLHPYLAAYSHSLHKEIGEASAPVTDWIGKYLNRDLAAE